jgi:hypothetical protein
MEFCLAKNHANMPEEDAVAQCGKRVAFLFKGDAQTLGEAAFSSRLLLLDDRSLIPGCKKHAMVHLRGVPPATEGSAGPATPAPSPSEAGCVKSYHEHLAANMTVSPGLLADCGSHVSWLNVATLTGHVHIETAEFTGYYAVREELGVLDKDLSSLEALRDDFGVPESDMNGFFNLVRVGANVPKGLWMWGTSKFFFFVEPAWLSAISLGLLTPQLSKVKVTLAPGFCNPAESAAGREVRLWEMFESQFIPDSPGAVLKGAVAFKTQTYSTPPSYI